MSLEEFVSVVNSLPEQQGGTSFNWGLEWQTALNHRCPGWITIAADPGNWAILEKDLQPKRNRDKLFMGMCDVVGSALANHWISSPDRDAVTAAKDWFADHLRSFNEFCEEGRLWAAGAAEGKKIDAWYITVELWDYLPSGTKKQFIETQWEWIERHQLTYFWSSFGWHALGATSREIDEYHHHFGGWRDNINMGRIMAFDRNLDKFRNRLARETGASAAHPSAPMPPEVALSRVFQRPGYVIPVEAERIFSIITEAKDHESLELWKALDEKSRRHWERLPARWVPVYDYTDEISGEIKSWLQQKQEILTPGAALPEWPSIEISEEAPPFFKHNPAMKKRYEEDQDWIFDGSPDFESLLGCYFSLQKKIVLWRKGIELCARRMGLGPDRQGLQVGELTRCVLVHELGHWFCDVAVVASSLDWDLHEIEVQINGHDEEIGYLPDVNQTTLTGTAWSLSSRSFHEVWAQWFAWLYGQEVDRGVLDAFMALEARQSPPYQAWRKLVSTKTPPGAGPYSLADLRFSQKKILKSLEWARALRDAKTGDPLPATFDDRNFPHTNLLDHLFP